MRDELELVGVVKRYGHITALADVSLAIPRRAVFGVLGLNGAGKTTLLDILGGVTAPDEGVVRGFTNDVVGYLSNHEARCPPRVTVRQALRFFARLSDKPQPRQAAQGALEESELVPFADRALAELSTGLARRVALAVVLMRRPSVLVLDEPTSGLDLPARLRVWDLMRRAAGAGTSVIISSHEPTEIREVCDDFVVLRGGVAHPSSEVARDTTSGRGVLEAAELAAALAEPSQ